jgi:2-polyprenyl-3-methyl-5-hydroxy-6-metoxy-1,4-benzoquinol methylase
MGAPEVSFYDTSYFDGPLAEWHRLSLPTFAAFLREAIGTQQLRTVLDLGCGVGTYGPILREFGERVVGCEGTEVAAARARETGQYEHVFCVDLETATAEQLGGPYELIFCSEVIEHLADTRRFCRLIAAVLAPNGLLVLTTTAYHFALFYYAFCLVPRQKGAYRDFLHGCFNDKAASRFVRSLWLLTGGHYHGFRARRLLAYMRETGLRIDRWRYANVQPVFPVAALTEERFHVGTNRLLTPLLHYAGTALNAWCRWTNLYGANILVAARRKAD